MDARLRVAVAAGAELGEGPVWDAARERLLWVDILAGELHALAPDGRAFEPLAVGPPLAAAVPAADGGLLLVLRDRIVRRACDGSGEDELAALALPEDVRFNDASCDPAGRLWVGTMCERRAGAGRLYRLDPGGGLSVHRDGLGISNGIGFSPDATVMYHVDTSAGTVFALPFDVDRGTLGAPRPFARIDPADGLPDGLCVDAEGGVWVALWQGAQLRRYAPGGALDAVVATPARSPTSCAFGGAGLDELFVTSSAWGGRELAGSDPHGGALMRGRVGVRGLPVAAFG